MLAVTQPSQALISHAAVTYVQLRERPAASHYDCLQALIVEARIVANVDAPQI